MSKITIYYQVEVTYFIPQPQKSVIEFDTAAEVDNLLKLPNKVDQVLFIAALDGKYDYGNFYLFLNKDDIAHIWLHEYREYIPIEARRHDDRNKVTFRYENGSTFEVPGREVLSRELALEALHYWLPNQNHLTTLEWL